MTEIVLVPLDADVRKAPIDRVIITTSEDLGQAFGRISAIADATGADPAKLAAIMLADELGRTGGQTFMGTAAVVVGVEDDPEIADGKTVTKVGADGISRTEVLQTFQHPDATPQCPGCGHGFATGILLAQHKLRCPQLRQAMMPEGIRVPEFEKDRVL